MPILQNQNRLFEQRFRLSKLCSSYFLTVFGPFLAYINQEKNPLPSIAFFKKNTEIPRKTKKIHSQVNTFLLPRPTPSKGRMGRQTGCYAAWWCGAGGMAGGPASRSLTHFKPPAAARRKRRPVGLVRAAVNSEVRRAGQDYDEDGAGETGCEGAEGWGASLGWALTLVGFPFLEGQH